MTNSVDWLALLDQAKDSGVTLDRSPVPPARYALKIVKAEATTSSNGNLMYKVTAEVQNGPHAGRYIFENITLTENTGSWFLRKMNALGANEAFFRTQPEPQQVADRILNAFFEGEVEVEPARGNYEPKNRIAKWFPASGAGAPVAGGPAPAAYSTPAPQAAPAPQQTAPAPAPQQAPAQAPAPAQDPWGSAPAAAPAPQQAAPAAAPQAPWESAPAPAPAPFQGDTPF